MNMSNIYHKLLSSFSMRISLYILSVATIAWATERVWIQQNNRITLGLPLTMADNITLSSDGATVNFNMKDNVGTHSCAYTDIKNVTFGDKQDVIAINFDGTDADIINPFAFQGVTIEKTNGNIVITSTSAEKLRYEVTGTTTDGSITISSESAFTLAEHMRKFKI